jgi:transposase
MSYTKWFGVDVSMEKLDISEFDGKQHIMHQIANTKKGIVRFFSRISPAPSCHVIMEATGAYHMLLFTELLRLGFPVSVVNPLRIKKFTQMEMVRAKTDKLDAKLIALFGFILKPPLNKLPSKERQKISSLFKAVRVYQKVISILHNNVHALTSSGVGEKSVINEFKRSIKLHKKSIDRLEEQIRELVEEHHHEVYKRLNEIPGVGPKTSSMIIGFFGNFEDFETAKQVVSFVGINPNPRLSGKSVRRASNITKKGNPLLRKILYLAALSAKQYNPECRALYERLLNKGMPKVKAQVAVAHKLLRQIFAVVKYERVWCPSYQRNDLT